MDNNFSLSLLYHMFTWDLLFFILSISLLSKNYLGVRDLKSVTFNKKRRKYLDCKTLGQRFIRSSGRLTKQPVVYDLLAHKLCCNG